MPRVDVVGPPGVGKTTLCRASAARRSDIDRWLTRGEAARLVALNVPARWREILRFSESFDASGYPPHFAQRFRNVCRKSAAADASEQLVLFDEPVTQRSVSFALRPWHGRVFATSYLERIPPPAGLVHVTCDLDENVDRLRNRAKQLDLHAVRDYSEVRDLSQTASQMCDEVAEVMIRKGCPVVEINVTTDFNHALKTFAEFIARLDSDNHDPS